MSNATVNPKDYVNFFDEKKGLMSWLYTTDHKRIGLMYLWSVLGFFVLGMTLGFFMKLEMLNPGRDVISPQTYNSFFTLHGIIMIFLVIIPAVPGVFGNFFLPIQIGAEDVSFPRLNLLSYYLYVIGGLMALSSALGLIDGKAIDTGWTFYVPYSLRTNTNVVIPLLAAFILGFSSILTGLNFVTTVHRLRAKGMTFFRMPLFVWGLYATSWIQVIATPVIGITLVLVIFERAFKIGVFDPAIGGDPILYQHMFWIYSHPAVYIMILPAMGAISELIATFAKRQIFGYKVMAMSTMAIALVGYFVYAHHMFTSGMSDTAKVVFSLFTYLVGVPTGVKIFNWVATLYKGSIELKTPMLFALMFIFIFSIGGFTGLVLGSLAPDVHLHDTTFVVAHFHYVMFGGAIFTFFGLIHYWMPKMFNRTYNEKLGKITVAFLFVGFNTLYFPMFIMGYLGMPRRYWDYLPEYQTYHVISTVGSWILITGILIMLYNIVTSVLWGKRPESINPWGGTTLEWTVPSPPPTLNFLTTPEITEDPYNYPSFNEEKH